MEHLLKGGFETMIALGAVMATGRKNAGLTHEEVVAILERDYKMGGMTQSTLSRLETGDKNSISPAQLVALRDIYGLNNNETFLALFETVGWVGIQRFVRDAIQNKQLRIASELLAFMDQAQAA